MQLRKFTVLAFLIPIFLSLGCDSSGQRTQKERESDIQGKWVVQNIELLTDPGLVTPSDSMDLVKMFGSQIWALAKGKSFEFKENGALTTDILDNDPTLGGEIAASVELSKTISFRYNLDSVLTIFIVSGGEVAVQAPVKVVSLNSQKMVWKVNALYKVILKKLK